MRVCALVRAIVRAGVPCQLHEGSVQFTAFELDDFVGLVLKLVFLLFD